MSKAGHAGLGLGDRLVLLVAWAVTCGVVYVFGFYVGKGTQERRPGVEDRVIRLPVTSAPPPEGQRARVPNDLTFYETLVSGKTADVPVTAPPPAPAAVPLPAPAPVPPPTVVARPAPSLPAPVVSPPMPGPTASVAPPRVEPVAAPTTTLPRPPPPSIARPATGGWTVEANPTRNRSEAEDLLYKLRGHGYDVRLVQVQRDGDTWYRLRVGRYPNPELASETVRKLRDREGVAHVFVASE